MSDLRGSRLAWVFVALVVSAAATLFYAGVPVLASGDHDDAHDLRERGEVMPLADILRHPALAGLRVLEADLEHEHGRAVYELEVLDSGGRVSKRYFDAGNGQPLDGDRGD